MTNISDDFILLGFGALAFALVFMLIQRASVALRHHLRALRASLNQQPRPVIMATYRRQRRAPQTNPALNQVAADIPAAPHAP
jgi:hypothetical protein